MAPKCCDINSYYTMGMQFMFYISSSEFQCEISFVFDMKQLEWVWTVGMWEGYELFVVPYQSPASNC